GHSAISRDMLGHLSKVLNRFDLLTEKAASIIKELKEKLSKIGLDEFSELDESLIHQLLEEFIKNDSSIFKEELSEDNRFQLLVNNLKLLIEVNDDENQSTNSKESVYLMTERVINHQEVNMDIQQQQLLQGITEVLSRLT